MPIISSVGRRFARTRKPVASGPYLYYRWRITKIRNFNIANSVQASEFVFQSNGADTYSTAPATVTNPGGSNPGSETPDKLYDGSTTTKALDFNIKTLTQSIFLYTFNTPQTFTGYRWATANDSPDRDPVSWFVEASNNNSTWTKLHEVSNFETTTSRFTSVGSWTYP